MPVPVFMAASALIIAMPYIQKSCEYGKEKLFSVVKGIDNTMNRIAQSLPVSDTKALTRRELVQNVPPEFYLTQKHGFEEFLQSIMGRRDFAAQKLLSTIMQQSDPQDQEVIKDIFKEHLAIIVKGLRREVDPKNPKDIRDYQEGISRAVGFVRGLMGPEDQKKDVYLDFCQNANIHNFIKSEKGQKFMRILYGALSAFKIQKFDVEKAVAPMKKELQVVSESLKGIFENKYHYSESVDDSKKLQEEVLDMMDAMKDENDQLNEELDKIINELEKAENGDNEKKQDLENRRAVVEERLDALEEEHRQAQADLRGFEAEPRMLEREIYQDKEVQVLQQKGQKIVNEAQAIANQVENFEIFYYVERIIPTFATWFHSSLKYVISDENEWRQQGMQLMLEESKDNPFLWYTDYKKNRKLLLQVKNQKKVLKDGILDKIATNKKTVEKALIEEYGVYPSKLFDKDCATLGIEKEEKDSLREFIDKGKFLLLFMKEEGKEEKYTKLINKRYRKSSFNLHPDKCIGATQEVLDKNRNLFHELNASKERMLNLSANAFLLGYEEQKKRDKVMEYYKAKVYRRLRKKEQNYNNSYSQKLDNKEHCPRQKNLFNVLGRLANREKYKNAAVQFMLSLYGGNHQTEKQQNKPTVPLTPENSQVGVLVHNI